MAIIGAKAGEPTNDYVYATELKYDNDFELYYFDVVLQGDNLYTAYGLDIQLPVGMEVVSDDDLIYVLKNDDMYPQNKLTKEYYHSVNAAFPNPDDHSHLRVGCLANGNKDMNATSGVLFSVYVLTNYTDNTWPVGAIDLYAVELDKVGAPFGAPDKETIVTLHSGLTTLPLNISADVKWSTCILPFDTTLPDGVTAYTSDSYDEDNIILTKAKSLEAYTPYVLYSENGYSGTVSGNVTTCPDSRYVQKGILYGAIVNQTVTEGYVLQKQSAGVQFYAISNGDSFDIPAGKCWMNIPDSNAKALGFRIDGTVTGINAVATPKSDVIFDIAGRQRQNIERGIVIMNGKKILKK